MSWRWRPDAASGDASGDATVTGHATVTGDEWADTAHAHYSEITRALLDLSDALATEDRCAALAAIARYQDLTGHVYLGRIPEEGP